jgi:hypothetical protein
MIAARTLRRTNAQTCDVTNAQTCDVTNARTCDVTNAQTCDVTNARTFDVTNAQTCDVTNAQTCDVTNAQTCDVTNAQTCDVTNAQTRDYSKPRQTSCQQRKLQQYNQAGSAVGQGFGDLRATAFIAPHKNRARRPRRHVPRACVSHCPAKTPPARYTKVTRVMRVLAQHLRLHIRWQW